MLNELGIEDQNAAWEELRAELRIHLLPHFAEEEAMLEALGVKRDRSEPVIRFHSEHGELDGLSENSTQPVQAQTRQKAAHVHHHVVPGESEPLCWFRTE